MKTYCCEEVSGSPDGHCPNETYMDPDTLRPYDRCHYHQIKYLEAVRIVNGNAIKNLKEERDALRKDALECLQRFKIMLPQKHSCAVSYVPLAVARRFEAQAQKNHYQSIDDLNRRGGLSPVEFFAVAHGMDWRKANALGEHYCIQWLEKSFGPMTDLAYLMQSFIDLYHILDEDKVTLGMMEGARKLAFDSLEKVGVDPRPLKKWRQE